jgi:hypothetical protein
MQSQLRIMRAFNVAENEFALGWLVVTLKHIENKGDSSHEISPLESPFFQNFRKRNTVHISDTASAGCATSTLFTFRL